MYYLLAFLLLTTSLSALEINQEQFLSEVIESTQQLSEINPSWQAKITDTHPNGSIAELFFIDEDGSFTKKLTYYPSGSVKSEEDGKGRTIFIPNGASFSFYEDGTVAQVLYLVDGKKEGLLQQFHPNGERALIASLQHDRLEGAAQSFDIHGAAIQKLHYVGGQPHGEALEYGANGIITKKANYQNGLLHGPYEENYPSGSIKAKKHYVLGLLHVKPATLYSEDGALLTSGNYQFGKKVGEWKEFFPSQQVRTSVSYINGKKHGAEIFYTETGSLICRSQFVMGSATGTHTRPLGSGSWKGVYTADCAVCEEQDAAGNQLCQYSLKKELLDGDYREWSSTHTLLKHLRYDHGVLDGKQQLFHQNGKPYVTAYFKNGKRDGNYCEWDTEGKQMINYTFIDDEPDGLCQSWHATGALEESSHYTRGLLHGKIERFSPKGIVTYECSWVDGHQEGKEIERYDNGAIAACYNYIDGQLDGPAERFYEDGSLKSKKQYRLGMPIGTHTKFYPKECKQRIQSEVTFNDEGLLEGPALRYFPSGQLQAECVYRKGLLQGRKRLFQENGTRVFEATYLLGKLEGPFFQKKASWIEVEATYKNNRLTGYYAEYYPPQDNKRQKAMEAEFVDGKLHGLMTSYTEQGTVMVAMMFDKGKRSGKARMYGDNGKLAMEAEFVNGVQEGTMIEYFPNGKVFRRCNFSCDLQDGQEEIFYDTGAQAKLCSYKNGKLHGLLQEWGPTHVLIFEAEFKNGLRHGKFNKYDENGTPLVKQIFENDILVSKEKYGDH